MYWTFRGIAWKAKKEYDKAIADFNEAIRLDPKDALAYYNRGVVWGDKKEYDRAIADFNEAIRLDPKDALAYGSRAWIWATCPDPKHRDGKRAVESATRACDLSDWKAAYALGTLAAAYAESGDFAKAVEYQEKAHKLYSDEDKKKWGKLLDLYKAKKPHRDQG
jgi:tetratricopeptide (TPR) repeat protein